MSTSKSLVDAIADVSNTKTAKNANQQMLDLLKMVQNNPANVAEAPKAKPAQPKEKDLQEPAATKSKEKSSAKKTGFKMSLIGVDNQTVETTNVRTELLDEFKGVVKQIASSATAIRKTVDLEDECEELFEHLLKHRDLLKLFIQQFGKFILNRQEFIRRLNSIKNLERNNATELIRLWNVLEQYAPNVRQWSVFYLNNTFRAAFKYLFTQFLENPREYAWVYYSNAAIHIIKIEDLIVHFNQKVNNSLILWKFWNDPKTTEEAKENMKKKIRDSVVLPYEDNLFYLLRPQPVRRIAIHGDFKRTPHQYVEILNALIRKELSYMGPELLKEMGKSGLFLENGAYRDDVREAYDACLARYNRLWLDLFGQGRRLGASKALFVDEHANSSFRKLAEKINGEVTSKYKPQREQAIARGGQFLKNLREEKGKLVFDYVGKAAAKQLEHPASTKATSKQPVKLTSVVTSPKPKSNEIPVPDKAEAQETVSDTIDEDLEEEEEVDFQDAVDEEAEEETDSKAPRTKSVKDAEEAVEKSGLLGETAVEIEEEEDMGFGLFG